MAQQNVESLFSPIELEELRETFHFMDRDKDGKIDLNELAIILKSRGIYQTESELAETLKLYDTNFDGLIDFQEYLQIANYKFKEKEFEAEEEVIEAFKVFDSDNKGYIKAKELYNLFLKEGLEKNEAEQLIKQMGATLNGKIEYEELFKRK